MRKGAWGDTTEPRKVRGGNRKGRVTLPPGPQAVRLSADDVRRLTYERHGREQSNRAPKHRRAETTAMMTLTDRQAQTRTEAEEFFRECYSLPVAVVGIASLFLTDIAVVVATIAAMG
jgi:hypothetical protein